MRVLITNERLNVRGGSESFVRDLARGLQNLGHSVIAYSSDLGQQQRLLESDLIPVSTDLENLPFRPDIIHGQHHLDAMTALIALPEVPAIYHCHGPVMLAVQPTHPRIYRYLASSKRLAERMTTESHVPPGQITVRRNTIDLERFQTVREAPVRPKRALFYDQVHRPGSTTLTVIREAAGRSGLQLDCVGHHFRNSFEFPETALPEYDLVFAAGRSAIEALACGCAVIVLGRTSCGGMVRTENFERMGEVNFTAAENSNPPSAEKIARELDGYSAEDCAAVCQRLRSEADFAEAVEDLVAIYESVIDQHSSAEPDPPAETGAVMRYLNKLVPLAKEMNEFGKRNWEIAQGAGSCEELRAELEIIEKEMGINRNK